VYAGILIFTQQLKRIPRMEQLCCYNCVVNAYTMSSQTVTASEVTILMAEKNYD